MNFQWKSLIRGSDSLRRQENFAEKQRLVEKRAMPPAEADTTDDSSSDGSFQEVNVSTELATFSEHLHRYISNLKADEISARSKASQTKKPDETEVDEAKVTDCREGKKDEAKIGEEEIDEDEIDEETICNEKVGERNIDEDVGEESVAEDEAAEKKIAEEKTAVGSTAEEKVAEVNVVKEKNDKEKIGARDQTRGPEEVSPRPKRTGGDQGVALNMPDERKASFVGFLEYLAHRISDEVKVDEEYPKQMSEMQRDLKYYADMIKSFCDQLLNEEERGKPKKTSPGDGKAAALSKKEQLQARLEYLVQQEIDTCMEEQRALNEERKARVNAIYRAKMREYEERRSSQRTRRINMILESEREVITKEAEMKFQAEIDRRYGRPNEVDELRELLRQENCRDPEYKEVPLWMAPPTGEDAKTWCDEDAYLKIFRNPSRDDNLYQPEPRDRNVSEQVTESACKPNSLKEYGKELIRISDSIVMNDTSGHWIPRMEPWTPPRHTFVTGVGDTPLAEKQQAQVTPNPGVRSPLDYMFPNSLHKSRFLEAVGIGTRAEQGDCSCGEELKYLNQPKQFLSPTWFPPSSQKSSFESAACNKKDDGGILQVEREKIERLNNRRAAMSARRADAEVPEAADPIFLQPFCN